MFEIYGRTTCVWCDQAKQLLTHHNQHFVFWNIETDSHALGRFKSLFPGAKTVPQIVKTVDNNHLHIGGYTDLAEYIHGTSSLSKHS